MADNATLSETLDEARELEAVRKDAVARLTDLRALGNHLIKAGKCSPEQAKQFAKVFPPKGRGAVPPKGKAVKK